MVEFKRVQVTPDAARKMLSESAGRFHNRNLKRHRVDAYASDMRNGAWAENGEPIIIDVDGVVIDGYHRLNAVIASGVKSVWMFICYGVDRDAALTIDQGASRNVGDALAIADAKNVNALMAAARSLHILRMAVDPESETGQRRDESVNLMTVNGMRTFLATNGAGLTEMMAMVPEAIGKCCSVTAMAALCYELSMVESKSMATEFVSGFLGGIPMHDPRNVLRERLILDRMRGRGSRFGSVGRIDLLCLLVVSWNLWIAGKSATSQSFQVTSRREFQVPVILSRAMAGVINHDSIGGIGSMRNILRRKV